MGKIVNEAKNVLKYFEHGKRNDGTKYRFIKDEAPEEYRELAYSAHLVDDVMPNDYIYDFIYDALTVISECDSDDHIEDEINSIEPDVYNSDLLKWISDNLTFSSWVDEAMKTYEAKDLFSALQIGQGLHRQAIANSVYESLQSIVKNKEK